MVKVKVRPLFLPFYMCFLSVLVVRGDASASSSILGFSQRHLTYGELLASLSVRWTEVWSPRFYYLDDASLQFGCFL